MQVDETEARLHTMLRDAGVDPSQPQVAATWSVFRSFMTEPVDSASDGVLVQAGIYDWDGPDRYVFDFLRQVEVLDEDNEHDHYEQLHCEFQFEPSDQLRAFGTFEEWWFQGDEISLDAFMDAIEGRPEFAAVIELSPTAASVEQEEV
jgi:hypothetical protein